jgi:hypothetical protein
MIEDSAFRTFITICCIFRSERLSANFELTLHKSLISSVLTYLCAWPVWEFAADPYPLELQRLQNKVIRTIGNFPKCTIVRVLQTGFNFPYVYDYIRKLGSQQAEVIQNHENVYVRSTGQSKTRHKKT